MVYRRIRISHKNFGVVSNNLKIYKGQQANCFLSAYAGYYRFNRRVRKSPHKVLCPFLRVAICIVCAGKRMRHFNNLKPENAHKPHLALIVTPQPFKIPRTAPGEADCCNLITILKLLRFYKLFHFNPSRISIISSHSFIYRCLQTGGVSFARSL